mgnify:FL=1
MPVIGTKTVSVHRMEADKAVYAGAANNLAFVDTVTLQRYPSNGKSPDRATMGIARTFPSADGKPLLVIVTKTAHIPKGVNVNDVTAWLSGEADATLGSTEFVNLSVKHDITIE